MQRSMVFFWGLLGLVLASQAIAQPPVLEVTEIVDFDRPEAWAMKYFASASLYTGIGGVRERDPGSVDIGLEVMQVPHLDQQQRTVGFNGLKEEDLNRLPAWGRVRVTWAPTRRWALSAGVVPPIEADGVEASLFNAAIERVLAGNERWSVGLRAYAQFGEAEGDFTCTEGGDELFPPGSAENPFGCEGPSADEATLEYFGLELNASIALGRGTVLHAGIATNEMDLEFQVNAPTFGFIDRTLLITEGSTFSANLGLTWGFAEKRGRFGVEAFYSPLDIQRLGTPTEDDDLFNLRAMVSWRLR